MGLLLLNGNKHLDTSEEALEGNANLMPIGESPKLDLVKEIDDIQPRKQSNDKDTYSSDGTEPYTESDENQDPNWNEEPKSPNGQLVTRKYGLKRKNTNQRKYTCAICVVMKRSAHKINEHHRESHPPVLCDICGKECSTPCL